MDSDAAPSLTERVLRFQQTGADGDAIVLDVARRVYEYPRRKCRWDEDSAGEFFVRVFPKIPQLIERFRYMGRPFESYLTSTLMYQIRSFAQERRKADLEWEAGACTALQADPADAQSLELLRPDPEGSWTALDPPLRDALGIGPDGRIGSPASRRRFLILCLKSAHLLGDGDLEAVSRIAEIEPKDLERMVDRLKERQGRKLKRVELYTGRRNRAFCAMRLIEMRLARETDREKRVLLERRSTCLSSTVRSCQHTVARIRLGPTHREIGELLGIPKPTVDSTIHRLKQRAAELYARRHAEYA
jgi:RNA polymerase sigma factor (sigma-70 family)